MLSQVADCLATPTALLLEGHLELLFIANVLESLDTVLDLPQGHVPCLTPCTLMVRQALSHLVVQLKRLQWQSAANAQLRICQNTANTRLLFHEKITCIISTTV